jgi:DNA-directed RNA polymerase specialized sigma24 family protein
MRPSVENIRMPDSESNSLPADFVTPLMVNQGALYAYVVSLMGGLDQANDVLQETNPERQLAALEGCVEKLPERQRELVSARYGRAEALQDIAARLGMPENAAAALFYRLRKALAACVELSLGKEATS